MSERCEVMKRKQKLQRRKKINRKAAATPQALIGNCRDFSRRAKEISWQTHGPKFSVRASRFTFLFLFVVHISSIHRLTSAKMAPKAKPARAVQENVQLGPQTREGELVFGVARIFASFNDTFVHVTDLS